MAETADVMAYFCKHYPFKDELSKARLNKMMYLADWKMALDHGRQITPIKWEFNHYGPYVDDVRRVAEADARFKVEDGVNMYGSRKETIRLVDDAAPNGFSTEEVAAMEHVIRTTKHLTYNKFINLVYSTYPIATQPRFATLDLVALAKTYGKKASVLQ